MTAPRLLDRVGKLLAKAEATSNPHEADAFALKAAALIAEHRIDPDQLARRQHDGEELQVRDVTLGRGAYVRGRLALLTAVAEPNDVRIVFHTTPEGMTALAAGFAGDLDAVEMLYTSLHQQAATQMARIKRATGPATQRYRRSFLFGYADRVRTMLAAAGADSNRDGCGSSGESSVALAMRRRAEQVDEFAARSFGRVVTARPARGAQANGWSAGERAATNADLGRRRVPGPKALGSG